MKGKRFRRFLAALVAMLLLFTAPGAVSVCAYMEEMELQNIAPQATYTFTHYDPSYPDYDPFSNPAWYKADETGRQLTDGSRAPVNDYEDEGWVGVSAYTAGTAVTTATFQFPASVVISSVVTSCHPASVEAGIDLPKQVTVSVSQNGTNWTPVAMADDTDPAKMLSIELDQAYKATYVKLDYLQKYGVGWTLFDEIEIYGTMDSSGGTDPSDELLSAGCAYVLEANDPVHNATTETFIANGWYKPDTNDAELTDGIFGSVADYEDTPWTGFSGWDSTVTAVTLDLGGLKAVYRAATNLFPAGKDGIQLPASIRMLLSVDGNTWMDMGVAEDEAGIKNYMLAEAYQARYVRLEYQNQGWIILDEIQVYGSHDPSSAKELDVNPAVDLADGKVYTLTLADSNGEILLPGEGETGNDSEGKKLTDGVKASSPNDRDDTAWVGTSGSTEVSVHGLKTGTAVMTFQIDLGQASSVEQIQMGFCTDGDILPPARMTVWLSQDGIDWIKQVDFTDYDGMSDFHLKKPVRARYVKIELQHTYEWLLLDEIDIIGHINADTVVGITDPTPCDTPSVQEPHVETPRPSTSVESRFPNNAAPEALSGYQKSSEGTDGIQDLVLLYNQYYKEGTGDYTVEKLYPYLAYLDREGRAVDTMFDGVLFLALNSNRWNNNNGNEVWRTFYTSGAPAEKIDFEWYLKKTFGASGDLDALEQTAELVAQNLGRPEYKVKTVIMAPVPSTDLGMGSRQAALDWYLNEVLSLFEEKNYSRVELSGLYILEEAITGGNQELVQRIVDFAHTNGLKAYWIPYFGADGVAENVWRTLGIDAVAYQPNSYFYDVNSGERLLATAQQASSKNIGIEIENGPEAIRQWDSFEKALDYLDASVLYNFQGEGAFRAYYQWVLGYERYCDPTKEDVTFKPGTLAYERGRQIYESTYRMMKGTLKISNRSMPEAPEVESVDGTVVTLKARQGYEYSRDGIQWQTDNVFKGLAPNTDYSFWQRIAETNTNNVSMISEAVSARTGVTETTHNYGESWKWDVENHWHECADCGGKKDLVPHIYGDWKIITHPTATKAGSRERNCTVCGHTVTEDIPATGNAVISDTTSQPTAAPLSYVPQTGDPFSLEICIGLLCVSIAALVVLVYIRVKRHQTVK